MGDPSLFWTAIGALANTANALIIAVTGLLIYEQVKIAARSFQFGSIAKMQEMVDRVINERHTLYKELPIKIVIASRQFNPQPPSRYKHHNISKTQLAAMQLTRDQEQALAQLTPDMIILAKKHISMLNDLGQLAEDGFIDYKVLLGKYHTMIIRLCHLLEAVRRQIEANDLGGNYGQRLLRMRHLAIMYNTIHSKHRSADIKITTSDGETTIIHGTHGSVTQNIAMFFKRLFFNYYISKYSR